MNDQPPDCEPVDSHSSAMSAAACSVSASMSINHSTTYSGIDDTHPDHVGGQPVSVLRLGVECHGVLPAQDTDTPVVVRMFAVRRLRAWALTRLFERRPRDDLLLHVNLPLVGDHPPAI